MLYSTLKNYILSGFDFDDLGDKIHGWSNGSHFVVGDTAKCIAQCSKAWTKTQDQQEFAECSSNCTNAAFSFQANAFITIALIFVFYLIEL